MKRHVDPAEAERIYAAAGAQVKVVARDRKRDIVEEYLNLL